MINVDNKQIKFPASRQPVSKLMLRRTILRFILYSVFSLLMVSSQGQQLLTLEEAIATVLQNNYDIQLARNDSAIAALNYSYRNAVFLPRLNANVSNAWNNNSERSLLANDSIRKGSGIKLDNFNTAVILNWTIFDGLKMFATKEKAAEMIKLGEFGIKEQIVNTIASVINTYYGVVREKQQLKAIEEQIAISQTRVDLAQKKLDIGMGTKPEVLQSKVDLNAQLATRLNQQTLIEQLKERLNALMNIQSAPFYDVVDSIPFNNSLILTDIQQGLVTTNPSLLFTQKNIDIANLTLKERRAERWPTVTFNGAYSYNRSQRNIIVNPFSVLRNNVNGYSYGYTVNIPILNNFNTRRLIKQAQLDIDYQYLLYQSQKLQLNTEVLNTFKGYEKQKKALALEEENILLAKENVTIALETYRLGATTFIQLREAQKSLEDAYNRLIAARYNTKLTETELMRLKGDLVK